DAAGDGAAGDLGRDGEGGAVEVEDVTAARGGEGDGGGPGVEDAEGHQGRVAVGLDRRDLVAELVQGRVERERERGRGVEDQPVLQALQPQDRQAREAAAALHGGTPALGPTSARGRAAERREPGSLKGGASSNMPRRP